MRTKKLIEAAVIASVYAVLTIALAPLSYGVMQVRVSEALTVLPALTSAAIPGLFAGCLIANMVGPYGIPDMIVGGTATLVAAFFSRMLRNRSLLVPLPPTVINGIAVGMLLHYGYGVPLPLFICIGWVTLGQIVSCYGLGYPLLKILKNYKNLFV